MKKFITVLALVLTISSCSIFVEDEFGNVIGTWEHPELPGYPAKNKYHPDIPHPSWEISVTFNKNLTGGLDKKSDQGDNEETDSFTYNVKGDQLTITFDEELANKWYAISGNNTYVIANDTLVLKSADETITKLVRK